MSSLTAIRTVTESSAAEQKRLIEKRRNIMILIHKHLLEFGYVNAAEMLESEAGLVLSKFEVADNVDLNLIFGDFETYYELRFDKKPKVVRKLDDTKTKPKIEKRSLPRAKSEEKSKLPTVSGAAPPATEEDGMSIQGSGVHSQPTPHDKSDDVDHVENRLLKPPPKFGGDAEMRQLAAMISNDIYQESPNVKFDDIIRLDEAKRLLREAVQLPLRYPTIFTGLLRPWKGILLHGPPGTGKTMLAKAVATECRTTFFNISASTLVSKWRGDSEKLVRALFELARYHAPSTIFFDEIDSILSSRGGESGSEHEASRRMKTELLVQMDGLRSRGAEEQVFVMTASNMPWDLDVAVLRRLEKRVLVPLPECEAREAMLRKHLSSRVAPDVDFAQVAQMTENYSGADIELLSREAAMKPVRRLMTRLQSQLASEASKPPPRRYGGKGSKSNVGVVQEDIEAELRNDPVTVQDVAEAWETTKPSSNGALNDKYAAWQKEFGSV